MTPIPPRDNPMIHSMTVAVVLGTIAGAMVTAGLVTLILRTSLGRLSGSLRSSLNEVQAQTTFMVQTMTMDLALQAQKNHESLTHEIQAHGAKSLNA